MIAAAPDRYRALLVFAAGMRLRQGECFGLTVDRVVFLRRQVRVDRQLVSALRGVPKFGPPKSRAGFRTVPMPDVVSSALAVHLARYRPGQYGLVFPSRTGTPSANTLGSMWHPGPASRRPVQRRLGHQSAMETLDTCGRLWPDSDDETRNAVDLVLAGITRAG